MRSLQPKHKKSFRKKPAFFQGHRKRSGGPIQESTAPRVHREAERLLADIGRPEPAAFVPDPFQNEAVRKVSKGDVLVSAPTGSGKTWIALETTKEFLSRGCRIWYATPLKALSNAKYEEFGEALGREQLGILTGDRKENADAPVIVGTTEILRNQLYDAMQTGTDIDVDLVILDEAHYLGDIDRGVVWEEGTDLPAGQGETSPALSHYFQRGGSGSVADSYPKQIVLGGLFWDPSGPTSRAFQDAGRRAYSFSQGQEPLSKGCRIRKGGKGSGREFQSQDIQR